MGRRGRSNWPRSRMYHPSPPRCECRCGLWADGLPDPLRRPAGALRHLIHRESAQRQAPARLVLRFRGKTLELQLLGLFHGDLLGPMAAKIGADPAVSRPAQVVALTHSTYWIGPDFDPPLARAPLRSRWNALHPPTLLNQQI